MLPKFHHVISTESRLGNYRRISLRVAYPPIFSDTAVILSDGAYGLENFSEGAGRWCASRCWIVARTCERGLALKVGNSTYNAEN